MKRERSVEPVVLNYASGRSARRYRPIDVILTVLFALVVVVIVLELAKPHFLGYTHGHPTDVARANMQCLTSPLELYRPHVGTYPVSLDDLYRLPTGLTEDRWGGPYLDAPDRLSDAWGQPYLYQAPGTKNPKWYDLWSTGKDGVNGTRDDIKNW